MTKNCDIVYKLGTGSKFNDDELRYSLRSLSNLKELGNVYIVGHKPKWIQNVIHIEASDGHITNKDANLINKILIACYNENLSQEFMHFSDDQVLIKPLSVEYFKQPIINNKYLNDVSIPGKKLNRWQTRLKRTFNKLKEFNLPYNCFEAHCPYLLDKTKYPSTLLRYDYGFDVGYTGNTLYFNTLKIKGKQLESNDLLRLEKQYLTINEIKQLALNKNMLNYTDSAINNILFDYLRDLFPVKSMYEM